MDKITFNELHDEIALREFPLGDSVYEFLNPDTDKALKIFARLVLSAVREYDKHYPITLNKTLPYGISFEQGYTFADNFDAYLAGNIDESQIEMVPEAIALIRTTHWTTPATANNFRYKKPTIVGVVGTTTLKYYAFHPVKYEISPDGKFTEDSAIYYVNMRDDTFINLVALKVLDYLKTTRESVSQPTGLQFFDFTQRIETLRMSVNEDFSTSAELYEMWGLG